MGIRTKNLFGRALASVAIVIGATVVAAGLAAAAAPQDFHGQFQETAVGEARGYSISGSVDMTVFTNRTTVDASVGGLTTGVTYGSHLHNGSCATGGGGHYQDVEGGATTPPNELWLSSSKDPFAGITPGRGAKVDAGGSAHWAARTDSATMTNARSIIIHDTDGARIACADLN